MNMNGNQMNNMAHTTMANFAQQPSLTTHSVSQMSQEPPNRNESNMSLEQIDTNSMLDLDYDVEQLLRHELALDANLDFNFDNSQNGPTSESQNMVR